MNWKAISLLPTELVNKDILLRIEMRDDGEIIYIVGNVDEYGDIYSDGRWDLELEGFGFLSRDLYERVYYVDPREIKL